jgi:hypothetical protein
MGTQNPSMYAPARPLSCSRRASSVLTEPRHSYQQVIDKTKSLSFRTHVLANNLDKYVVRPSPFNLLITPLSSWLVHALTPLLLQQSEGDDKAQA